MGTGKASVVQTTGDLRFPLGAFSPPETITVADRIHAIAGLAELPTHLRNAVDDLDAEQLDTPYRDGGWTVRQLVHHIADSHMNAVLRVRLALTEDWPTITAYDEKAWARMHDYEGPVEWSLELIESLHARWVLLLQSICADEWKCGFKHPKMGPVTLEKATLLYAWHSRHHVAHIMHLRAREDW
ncbi:MAG: putative metal-dependent hydrolase [Acidobacteriota bacterium]|nr:putative metal-dependent hydrolase [Acidobacteriota bacterium]